MSDEFASYITALGIISIFMFLLIIGMLVNYVLTAYPMYKMFQKAGLKNPKYAFIPFVNSIKLFNLANFSGWYYLLLLIPYVGTFAFSILSLYIYWKIAENYGLDVIGCILTILFPIPALWYLALSQRQFVGNLDAKYLDYQYNDNQYNL